MFSIDSVSRVDGETVRVAVRVEAKYWHACKAKGQLGALYGVDISNAVWHGYQVKAYHPTVDDSARANDGFKSVILFYSDKDWIPAPNNVVRVDFVARKRVA